MEHQDLLLTTAEVGAAFAGFTAIISVFARRDGNEDPRITHFRIRLMIETSLAVVIFSLLPYLLHRLAGDEAAWRVASALLAVALGVILTLSFRRAKEVVGATPFEYAPAYAAVSFSIMVPAQVILLANAAGSSLGSPGDAFVLGLFAPLLQSAVVFLRIVMSADPTRGSPL